MKRRPVVPPHWSAIALFVLFLLLLPVMYQLGGAVLLGNQWQSGRELARDFVQTVIDLALMAAVLAVIVSMCLGPALLARGRRHELTITLLGVGAVCCGCIAGAVAFGGRFDLMGLMAGGFALVCAAAWVATLIWASVSPQVSLQPVDGPGQFRVFGVDRESGFDTRAVIEAESHLNARIKAELRGIVVAKVERIPVSTVDASSRRGPPSTTV